MDFRLWGFAGSNRRARGLQMISDEFISIRLDQFTVDDKGLRRQHVAVFGQLIRLQKDVPRRAPATRIARRLAVGKVRGLLSIIATLGLFEDRIRQGAVTKKLSYIVARGVLADPDHHKALVPVLLIKLRRDGRFVAPVGTPG